MSADQCRLVLDKSRGLGGRLATRRHEMGPFNHGAPGVLPVDAGFAAYRAHAAAQGSALNDGASVARSAGDERPCAPSRAAGQSLLEI